MEDENLLARLETKFFKVEEAIAEAQVSIDKLTSLSTDFQELSQFYTSDQWLELMDSQDNSLKSYHILSEDALFNLITEQQELLGSLLKLLPKLYENI